MLRSFPEPSETFISEEAASLFEFEIKPSIIYLVEGDSSIIHPATRVLLRDANRLHARKLGFFYIVYYLILWLFASPCRTSKTFLKALRDEYRWCYLQALMPAWWCRTNKIDFIHSHFADVNFLYSSAISEWAGIPFGVTTHGYDLRENPLGLSTTTALLRKAKLVVTISEFNRRFMIDHYGLAKSDVVLIHCGVDVQRFFFGPNSFPIPGHPVRILNVGRLAWEKGQDILLHSVACLRDKNINFQLDIVGAGKLELQLKQLAEKLCIDDNVVFHGAKTQQEIIDLHRQAHLFILSSRSEGLPIVCIEALALGTPTIATRINGIPELIDDGINGLLVEADNPENLADAIFKMLESDEKVEQIRFRGRETVLSRFERRRCSQELISHWVRVTASN